MKIYALHNKNTGDYVAQDFVEFQEHSETILRPMQESEDKSVLCTTDKDKLRSILHVAKTMYDWNTYGKYLVDSYSEVKNLQDYSIVELTPNQG